MSDELVSMVRNANPNREQQNVSRRLLKVLEELGETSEACLSVSSPDNYKSKNWEDYREEAVDTLIVLIDIALTPGNLSPGQALISPVIRAAKIHSVESLDELYDEKFVIAGAVSATALHLKENDTMGALGALMRGITAAANMCFAQIPSDADASKTIELQVRDIFAKKIDKWNTNQRQFSEGV